MNAQGVINTQETQNYQGTYPAPNVCPGCGKCRDCGRPYETQPQMPYIGDPLYKFTCGTVTSVPSLHTIAGGVGAQSIQPNF